MHDMRSFINNLPKHTIVTVGLIICIGLAVAGYELWLKPTGGYKYSKLDQYTLYGGVDGSGMSFKKPIEANSIMRSRGTPTTIIHTFGKDNLLGSYISVGITPLLHPLDSQTLSSFDTAINNPSGKYYAGTTKAIEGFAKNSLQAKTSSTFSNAQKFTNSSVKSHAWEFNYTASPQSFTAKRNITGTEIFTIGNKGYYYFNIYMSDRNWESNQKTIQQILASIKVDQ